MTITKHIILEEKHKKPIVTDVFYTNNNTPKPVIIFCHGYKGFKDWGAWDLMAEAFSSAGYFFIKFNFSHNGGTVEQPIDFPDLEAFGNNNYTKELDDLEAVIDWIYKSSEFENNLDKTNINLIGHSRGGGIVTIKAEEDQRITKVISLAGVSDYGSRGPLIGNIEEWKKDGVKYVENSRTKQHMPHYYQFYEDFKANEERLTIKRAVSNLKIPYLIIHGDADTSVAINEAHQLHKWSGKSNLEIIEGADHVFNTKHPWDANAVSPALKRVIELIDAFIKE
ncbi:alpha/beta hydrolase family protein [Jejuia pallidilutea]|uniref:Alpha/beta hydrolase family protein n=1 Tax=Jejuia pallidilutea TaxID=504487 RepID=A0A362X3S8_9FLAO|nr:alpha/beta hydrolase [Jejuia pallidilutea]PQV49492.1 alpha/beta hydrolase family protein [Jejuia pallidilutea]